MSWRFHYTNQFKSDFIGEILAPKRIYTRANPNPNPPKAVENPEKILRKSSSKVGKETYHLYKSTCVPVEGVESIDEITFDLKFEHSLFRSKFESDLGQIVFDLSF